MQWGADDSGTTGTVDPDINADGVVAVFFDPPLTGDFAIRMNFASASIAFFGYDADSVTSVPTPVSQDSNWQSYSFGEVVNLRYVSIKETVAGFQSAIRYFTLNGTQLEDGGQPRLTKKIVSDSTLTVAGPTDLTDAFVGGAWMTDGTTAVGGTYKQTPYTLTTSQITGVSSESFNATYTGVTYSGYEGKNAFDISEDKLPFPNGIGPLDNSENQKSTRASDNETVTIALSEDIEVTADSEIYILFQSEAKSGQPTPVVRVVGRDSTYEAMILTTNISVPSTDGCKFQQVWATSMKFELHQLPVVLLDLRK